MRASKIPAHFEVIRSSAAALWAQLDANEELAAPWRQMFRQVTQTPAHVVSELLQNADDAGATWARVFIEKGVFVLEHDGADFDESDLRSLCRFGFSNKRSLLTIGFRGIGFKSTFSLGPTVFLTTRTLSLRFREEHFTLPEWNDEISPSPHVTVRVPIADAMREASLRLNFEQWQSAPASLLFFSSLRRVEIEKAVLEAVSLGEGPAGTQRYELHGGGRVVDVLLARSEEESFPADALKEVRNERDADIVLPPCRVDVVLGLPGSQRAFAVLPTEVALDTPFSVNGPFVQTPDRERIRDPASSATNRWLLRRAGRLAAETMLAWLSDEARPIEERQQAYGLLPNSPGTARSDQPEPNALIGSGFANLGSAPAVLLGVDADLHTRPDCPAVPPVLFDVWATDDLRSIFAQAASTFLAPDVSHEHRTRLVAWGWLSSISKSQVADTLSQTSPPRPSTDDALFRLWALLVSTLRGGAFTWRARRLHVVPVIGDGRLRRVDQVVRLPLREDEGGPVVEFLAERLSVVEQAFMEALDGVTEDSAEEWKLAAQLQRELELHQPERQRSIVKRASDLVFAQDPPNREAAILLAHITAKSGARPPSGFRWLCQDGSWQQPDVGLLADVPDELRVLLPEKWMESRLLHEAYFEPSDACSGEDWLLWLRGSASPTTRFPGPSVRSSRMFSRSKLVELIRARGGEPPRTYHYKSDNFEIIDSDFDDDLWNHWRHAGRADEAFWPQVGRAIFTHVPSEQLLGRTQLEVRHLGYSKRPKLEITGADVGWVRRLRSVPCLPDQNDKAAQPADLHRFTETTSPLVGVERFVASDLDTAERAKVLDLLGVHSTPADADRIVDRLRALSGHAGVPETELVKWYTVLDRMTPRMKPDALVALTSAFAEEALILTSDQQWLASGDVFVWPDDELDGLPTVLPGVRELGLWRRVGVRERPTSALLLARLRELRPGDSITGPQLAWVRKTLARLGETAWLETGHWLSTSGHWVPTRTLEWSASREDAPLVKHLFPRTKERVADMRALPVGQHWDAMPAPLGAGLTWRVTDRSAKGKTGAPPAWFSELTQCIYRTVSEEQARDAAARLFNSTWQPCSRLRVTPYLAAEPVGESVARDVAWEGGVIFVRQDLGEAHLAESMVDEIARLIPERDLPRAIRVCVFRTASFVREYFGTHFELSQEDVPQLAHGAPTHAADALRDIGGRSPPSPAAKVPDAGPLDGEHDDLAVVEEADDPSLSEEFETNDADDAVVGDEEALVQPEDGLPTPELPPAELEDPGIDASPPDDRERRPSPLRAYATNCGFTWDAETSTFRHPDGRSIHRLERQELFQWRLKHVGSATTDIWVGERGSLEKGVVVPTEVWEALKSRSDTGLILPTNSGADLLPADQLASEVDRGNLVLFPASYRLRRR
ncbi:MAG: hypothetical protein CMN31_19880 [Sandaracinus sp.]|nr:hypothetical protein [Sandaracinus sp.]MBJ73552.1 hypothetical protein [Sandaracinus sp.]